MVMRWWRHIKMLKRAGRGHDPDGVAATKEGALAVDCPACPQDGRNLPENWRSAPAAVGYIFYLHAELPVHTDIQILQLDIYALPCDGCQFPAEVEGPSY